MLPSWFVTALRTFCIPCVQMKTSVSCTALQKTLTSSSPCPAKSKTAPPALIMKETSVLMERVRYGAFILLTLAVDELLDHLGQTLHYKRLLHRLLQSSSCCIYYAGVQSMITVDNRVLKWRSGCSLMSYVYFCKDFFKMCRLITWK